MVAAAMMAACAHGMESAGDVAIDPAEAAQTVVLNVKNQSTEPLELRTVLEGRSTFIGSVGPVEITSILLDPSLLPAGFLYIVGIPADGRGRALVGPLAASKGDKIRFTISPELSMSSATVIR
jgi:hypothetical protein